MAERSHLSIGEVLSLLREEFPDVTISKIRFLESQGLVDPERTPSGYRKFYEHDVERLRWILRQQRENFLPLKIIRGRLTDQEDEPEEAGGGSDSAVGEQAAAPTDPKLSEVDQETPGIRPATTEVDLEPSRVGPSPIEDPLGTHQSGTRTSGTHPSGSGRHRATTSGGGGTAAAPAPAVAPAEAAAGGAGAGGAQPATTTHRGRNPAPAEIRRRPGAGTQPALGEEVETFSAEELAEAASGTVAMVKDLQQYGLISTRTVVGGTPYFDLAALDVARAAAGFALHGVEARHLRAWRNAADREAGIFEQVIMPLLRQRNPEARRQAADTLSELATLGGDLRKALIDQALRQIH